MKKFVKKITAIASVCIILFGFFACEEDDVDEFGSAQLKIVHASQKAATQKFVLLDNILKEGLNYTESSEYISTNSGNRLSASFRNQDNGNWYAEGELWLANTKRYTIYLVGSGNRARVKQFEDDASSPSSGKAKIKFIHLSDGISSTIKIKDSTGEELVNSLTINLESGYKSINPGTFSFSIYTIGTGSHIKDFQVSDIQEGRIYTIYLAGESSSTVEAHKVVY